MSERQVKTGCRYRATRNARSKPDIDIFRLTVRNVTSISMLAAPGQEPTYPWTSEFGTRVVPLLYATYTLRDGIDGLEQMQRGTTSDE